MPTLLVVDDEPGICYSLKRVFGGDGTEVFTAGTAAAGLAEARARNPDVVVLDFQLPDRSGLDVFTDRDGTYNVMAVGTRKDADAKKNFDPRGVEYRSEGGRP